MLEIIIEFLQQNLTAIFSFLGSGVLISWATKKYTIKSAEANAMKQVQDVYQETVQDLREDKDLLKADIRELQFIVNRLTQDIEEIRNYECVAIDCALRKKRFKPNKPIYEKN